MLKLTDQRTVDEPTYEELICWCKLNIKQLLAIGYADTDEHRLTAMYRPLKN